MSISVLKAENAISKQVESGILVFEGERLRTQIREIITKFNESAIPIPPSANDILLPFMIANVSEFVDVTYQIEQALLKKNNNSDADVRLLYNRRDELMGAAVTSDGFKQYRSKCYADYSLNIEKYNQLQETVIRLKPFLGMPTLPRIEVVLIDPEILLSALQNAAGDEPCAGQMVLRVDEPFHEKPMYWPKGIANGRIDNRLADKIVAVPYPLESVQANAAEAKGAILRNGIMCFPVVDGVPVTDGSWHSINALLPFALRSLCVPAAPMLMPDLAPDLHDMFARQALEPIYHRALAASNGLCVYCGSSHDVTAVTFWRFREPVIGGPLLGVQILSNLWALCSDCKDALRPSYNRLNQTQKPDNQRFIAPNTQMMERLILLNHWMEDLAIENARTAYTMCAESRVRRNTLRWIVDVSWLKSDYLVLKDNLEIGGSGWIDEISGKKRRSLFKVVGAGFMGPGKIRVFFSKPSIFDARWDATMDSVHKRLDESDLTIVEGGGQVDNLSAINDVEANVQSKDNLPDRDRPVDLPFCKVFLFDPGAADYHEVEIASGKHLSDELLEGKEDSEDENEYEDDDEDDDSEPLTSVPKDHVDDDYKSLKSTDGSHRPVKF